MHQFHGRVLTKLAGDPLGFSRLAEKTGVTIATDRSRATAEMEFFTLSEFLIRSAQPADAPVLAALRATLWPEGSVNEHAQELASQLQSVDDCMLVAVADGRVVGFLEARLRSHADGCETSPVGYLEGWFVAEDWRGRGIGRALVDRFERWARERGCRELASDTWLHNVASQRAHESLGFNEVDRIVTYRKALDPDLRLGPHARPPLQA